MRAGDLISSLNKTRPILIAGPTGCGKSALAIRIATTLGGLIINADAMQVFAGWRILTARPTKNDEMATSHALYGHINNLETYSVGDWLQQIKPLLDGPERPIIVGGTGLYFKALTEGLAEIPKIPEKIKTEASDFIKTGRLSDMIGELDVETRSKIDLKNPVRVARAWEVWRTTGKSITFWHANTPVAFLNYEKCDAICLHGPTSWLNQRIEERFKTMLRKGVLTEVERNFKKWNPTLQSSQAIGAAELIDHLSGDLSIEKASELAIIASRQYAKRQRTWFRKRMAAWTNVDAEKLWQL
tara:strand:- start:1995 stop:2894 length:900 start_codon:yes stop_codon:yes gene_type:complete